jgi:hypothetical protein
MKTTLEMAREAGFVIDVSTDPNSPPSWWGAGHDDKFKAFEALVRADEREACAKVAQETICDTHIPTNVNIYGTRAAKAIRARGNK